MSGDGDWILVLAAGIGGCLLGILAALLWRARREQASRIELEVLRARIRSDESAAAERDLALARTREQLQGVFGELARDSLKSNSELFLQLARERLGHQASDAAAALKERETAIESLVQPIRETLARTEAQIESIERARIDSFATIKAQMESLASGQSTLSRETRNLVTALRRPDVRGRWGEITLKRLVELAGMSAHVDFSEQRRLLTDDGAIRPDMIVHMPERRDIVVDVKTPLDAYLAAVEATERGGARARSCGATRSWSARACASLREAATGRSSSTARISSCCSCRAINSCRRRSSRILASSTRHCGRTSCSRRRRASSPCLKAVAYGWKQSSLAENAAEIRRLGEDLYKRLAVFAEHLGRLGRSLGGSVDAFNKAVGSLEQQVLPAARRFPELGLRVPREIEPLDPIEALTRTPRVAGSAASESTADESAADST